MVVEDVAAMRLYLRYALERYGLRVIEAESITAARRLLHQGWRPTSVLLDLELPDGNGLELLHDLPRDTPVAALTGDHSSETAQHCMAAGCALVLCKGDKLADIGHILEKIERDWQRRPLQPRHDAGLLARYQDYLAETLHEMQLAASERDLGMLRRLGHRLCGTAVHFGYEAIGTSARQLGGAIAAGDTPLIDAALDKLLQSLANAVGIHAMRPSLPSSGST